MAVDHHVYRFGEFTLDVAERQLLRKDREVPLRPKAFDTIAFLVEQHGHLVTKDALVERVWPETSVSDAVLTHCVAEVRRALDDPVARPRYVRTTSGAGYRFVGAVEVA
ncbi:MAG: transcriptional regulator, partial [Holophagales bacterium]|nr:transcriptional regulator [Holophagales bacterium]